MQVLDDGRLQAFAALGHFVDLDPCQTLGTVDLDELGVAIDLATRNGSTAGHAQGHHTATPWG